VALIHRADRIPGWPGGPYGWHPEFLDEHLFWISHLASFFHDPAVQELLLGPDDRAAGEFAAAVDDLPHWPLFVVTLEDDRRVYLCYCTLPDDRGIHFLVHDPRSSRTITASSTEDGLSRYLSWPELLPPHGNVGDRAARLLLLLPILDVEDLPSDAAATLSTALAELTAIEKPDELATRLLATHL
jgi:hypothetical protein